MKKIRNVNNFESINRRLYWASSHSEPEILENYDVNERGLDNEGVEKSRDDHGRNIFTYGKKNTLTKRLVEAFINPFTVVLLILAVISVFTDIVLASADDRNYVTVIIITTMVMISGILRFIQ